MTISSSPTIFEPMLTSVGSRTIVGNNVTKQSNYTQKTAPVVGARNTLQYVLKGLPLFDVGDRSKLLLANSTIQYKFC